MDPDNGTEFVGEWGRRWRLHRDHPVGTPGGFASVYVGESSHGDEVAVKVIGPVLPSGARLHPSLQERELDIATRLREVRAPHLVEILDVARVGDEVMIVMELARGSLADVGEMRREDVVATLGDITSGLMELHQAGIIHRDLKPSNVLRIADTWKLADFGIARDQTIGTADPTFVGWGSGAYMAPELWLGRSPNVKTDLYALGCVAHQLLTGSPPFHGREANDYRRQHLEDPPPALPADVEAALRELVTRLLAKDPGDRPQDARAVMDRLAWVDRTASVWHRSLQELSAQHASERSQAGVQARKARESEERERVRRQATADLREICEDALQEIRKGIPEAKLEVDGRSMVFETDDASLTLDV